MERIVHGAHADWLVTFNYPDTPQSFGGLLKESDCSYEIWHQGVLVLLAPFGSVRCIQQVIEEGAE